MEPEITLLGVFTISLVVQKITLERFLFPLSGRIAMAAMLVVTGIAHFFFTKGMSMMIPDFISFKIELVYFTGLAELAAAIGLLVPRFKIITAWCLILFFLLILPTNIYAAMKTVDLETASNSGDGLNYLWYRIPLQLFFISWIYLSSIRNGKC